MGFAFVADWMERAVVWNVDGTVEFPAELAGDNSSLAMAIAPDGTLVGWGRRGSSWPYEHIAFMMRGGTVLNLGALQRPMAINNAGDVAGYSVPRQDKAYHWSRGKLTNLHEHPSIAGVTSRAWDLDDSDHVVGQAQFFLSNPEEPVLWSDGTPQRLIADIARVQGVATGINGLGQIAGYYIDMDDLSMPFQGFIWQAGVRQELLPLLHAPLGWEVLFPLDINDRAEIVGHGIRNGQMGRAFVMRPLP